MRPARRISASLLAVYVCAATAKKQPNVTSERPDSCIFKFVPIEPSELAWYWKGSEDRCRLLAEDDANASKCGKGETPSWDNGGIDRHYCHRNADGGEHLITMRQRPHLRRRLRRLPPKGTPMVEQLITALGDRKLFWLGDSIANQLTRYLNLWVRESPQPVSKSIPFADKNAMNRVAWPQPPNSDAKDPKA